MRRILLVVLCGALLLVCAGCGGGGNSFTVSGKAGVGEVTLTWNYSGRCWVYQGTSPSEMYRIEVDGYRALKSPLTITDLTSGQTYWFKVQQIDSSGNPANVMSNVISITVL